MARPNSELNLLIKNMEDKGFDVAIEGYIYHLNDPILEASIQQLRFWKQAVLDRIDQLQEIRIDE